MEKTYSTTAIAALNDRLRAEGPSAEVPGRVVITQGIAALPWIVQMRVHENIVGYDDFSESDDPHGEHDFGAFDIAYIGKVFWKIDYYALDLENGSEDPADPSKTVRVLTVMLASEY